MDYFKFDLQLFATDVDLSGASSTNVYLTSEENWVADITDKTVIAKLTYNGDDPTTLEVVTGKTVKGVTAGMNVKVSTFESGTATAASGAVTFQDSTGAALGTITTTTAGTITYGENDQVAVPLTATVTGTNMTATAGGATFALNTTEANITLVSGNVQVAAGATIKVGANTFTNATMSGDDPTVAAITAENGTITFKKGVAFKSGDATIANTSTDAGATITVGEAGLVSKPTANAVFTVKASATDEDVTTYTVDNTPSRIVATGDRVGIYAVTDADELTTVTIAADGTVQKGGATAAAKPIILPVNAAAATVVNAATKAVCYYTLAADGTVVYKSSDPTVAPKIPDDCIGYFISETEWNSGSPTVTVTFVGGYTVDPETDERTATVTDYLGEITVNMTAVQAITNTAAGGGVAPKPVNTLVVTGISGAKADDTDITVTNLPKGADTSTEVKSKTYTTWYSLDENACTITMEALTGDAKTYYAIQADTTKQAETGEVVYKLVKADGTTITIPPGSGTAYFQVAVAVAGNATTYTVDYHDNSGSPNTLGDDCWNGLVVNANAIPAPTAEETAAGKTTTINIADNAGAGDKYDVQKINNGVKVTGTAVINREYNSPVKYAFAPGSGTIALDDAGDAVSDLAYVVTKTDNYDGTVTVTIGTAKNVEDLTADDKAKGYITVSTSKKTSEADGEGSVTINYTKGTDSTKSVELTGDVAITVDAT